MLAEIDRSKRYMALKIAGAKSGREGQELKILTSLDQRTDHPGKHHVQQLLDHFEHEGPNGRHRCLVFEPMGRNLNQYQEAYEDEQREPAFDQKVDLPMNLPLKFTRHLCKQLIMALYYLHGQKIIHLDIQPGNILFAPSFTIDEHTYESDAYHIVPKRVDGQPLGDGDPKYLLEAETLQDAVPFTAPPPDFRIVLADLGSASSMEDSNNGLHSYPLLLQAPEVALELPFDEKADIWNLGYVIFEIVTNRRLFAARTFFGTVEEKQDALLYEMMDRLGPMPEPLLSQIPRPQNKYFDIAKTWAPTGVREMLEEYRVKDMSDAELDAFESFIQSTMQYEPRKRASTQELLQHPWIVNF